MNIEIEKTILEILKIVDSSGLYLSPQIDKLTLDKLQKNLPKNQDITSFVLLDEEGKYRLAVRTYLKYREALDFKTQTRKAKYEYLQENYSKALKLNLKTLKNINKPKAYPYLFGSIGMTYLHMNNISSAIPYLETATLLGREKHKKVDYTDLINQLRKPKELDKSENIKIEFNENEFYNDSIDYFELTNKEEIIDLINNGVKLMDIVHNLNLSHEEYLKVLLYLAKEYYSLGMFKLGDKLLLLVEKNKNKTEKIEYLKEGIRKKRLFYQYRDKDTQFLIKTYCIKF